jgi:hypothetical protein
LLDKKVSSQSLKINWIDHPHDWPAGIGEEHVGEKDSGDFAQDVVGGVV